MQLEDLVVVKNIPLFCLLLCRDQNSSLSMNPRYSFPLLGLLLISLLKQPVKSEIHAHNNCEDPNIGTFLIVSQGIDQDIPIGQLQLETWNKNGTLSGISFLRKGRKYRSVAYNGRWQSINDCNVKVSRSNVGMNSNVLLKTNGDPHFGIISTLGVVASERWFPQVATPCTEDTIAGEVFSIQEGHQFRNGQWQPNRVIQREQWRGWRMSGHAISSYSGQFEEATYQGNFTRIDNCIGSIKQQDSKGVSYAYVAILRSDGKGYAYLQTQGNALTVAVLDRVLK